MTTYILTTEAEADLRNVIRYTRKQWGAAQVRHYVANLEKGIASLAAGEGYFRDMSDLYPALRMARCEHYYVFCQPNEVSPDFGVIYLSEGIVQCNGFVARHEVREDVRIFDGDRQIIGSRNAFKEI